MTYPIHSLLFAAFPLLFLIGHNRDRSNGVDAVVPLLVTLAVTAVLLVVSGRLTKQPRKAGVVISTLALLFFTYGHVYELVRDETIGGFVVGRDIVLGPLYLLAGAAVIVAVWRTRRGLTDLTRSLNILSIALIAVSLYTIALGPRGSAVPVAPAMTATATATPGQPPDIYYFVFDRYADAETLKTHFGFDNEPFYADLERRGFVIARDAKANYQNTHLSLASSLNANTLDAIGRKLGKTGDLKPAFSAISHNGVGTFLRKQGYEYVHIGSWAAFTAASAVADENVKVVPLSEFTRTFYESTALLPFLRRGYIGGGDVTAEQIQHTATRNAFTEIERVTKRRGPKFVFAHLLVPHPPYIFDRNGNVHFNAQREGNRDGYLEQVRYTNNQITAFLDEALAGDNDPIIVLAADEGPYPRLSTSVPGTWLNAPAPALRVKYGIFSAYRLPGHSDAVYPALSPVNTFRVIFNEYFGTGMPLLPDESYGSVSAQDVYTFEPFGDRVRGHPDPWVTK